MSLLGIDPFRLFSRKTEICGFKLEEEIIF